MIVIALNIIYKSNINKPYLYCLDKEYYHTNTLLVIVCEMDNISLINLLISFGANINASNEDKISYILVYLCTCKYNTNIIKLLVQYGLDINEHIEGEDWTSDDRRVLEGRGIYEV